MPRRMRDGLPHAYARYHVYPTCLRGRSTYVRGVEWMSRWLRDGMSDAYAMRLRSRSRGKRTHKDTLPLVKSSPSVLRTSPAEKHGRRNSPKCRRARNLGEENAA